MKSRLLGAVCACATALVFSTSANAAIISYGGYSHDTTTDIVTGNGLEWLQWDRTLGQSINSIQSQLDTLEGGGWSIASNVQMAQLFNAFDFGLTFDSGVNDVQTVNTGYSVGDPGTEADEMFINMFGDTYGASGRVDCYGGDCITQARAHFGDEGNYRDVALIEDYVRFYGSENGRIAWSSTNSGVDYQRDYIGVALVRDVSAVPVPAAVWLFGSGLIGLAGVARRKK